MRRSGFDVGHAMAQRLGRVALAGAALLAACDAVPADVPQIPRIGPAHEAGGAAALAVRGPIQLALDDVSFRTSLGHQVSIERIEVMGEAGRISRDRVELDLVRIVGLDVVTPADTIVTGFDAFIEVPGPRLIVRTLRVEDARFAAEAHPGQAPGPWLWRMPRLDLVATDVRLGGDELDLEARRQMKALLLLVRSKRLGCSNVRFEGILLAAGLRAHGKVNCDKDEQVHERVRRHFGLEASPGTRHHGSIAFLPLAV